MSLYHRNAFTFTWQIENLSFYTNASLDSSPFYVESFEKTKWYLELEQTTSMLCYLRRADDDHGPNEIGIFFNIYFVKPSAPSHFLYEKSGSHGQTLVEDVKNWKAPKVTNVVCCMWRHEVQHATSAIQSMQYLSHSRICLAKYSAKWVIKVFPESFYPPKMYTNFSTRVSNLEKLPIFCVSFSHENHIMYPIRIQPSTDLSKRIHMYCKVTIQGGNQRSFESDTVFNCQTNYWTFPMEILECNLRTHCTRKFFDKERFLTLQCDFSISDGTVTSIVDNSTSYVKNSNLEEDAPSKSVSTQTEENDLGKDRISTVDNPVRSLREDLKIFYTNETLSDIKLRVGDQVFPAHKSILSARSPVFHVMFGSEMSEKLTREANITDIDADTLNRFLVYIYSDTLDELQWESAAQLYFAADKYQVSSLKNECSSFLMSHLTNDNVYEALVLGDDHQDNDLKLASANYVCAYAAEIFPTDTWRSFMKDKQSLAGEVTYIFSLMKLQI